MSVLSGWSLQYRSNAPMICCCFYIFVSIENWWVFWKWDCFYIFASIENWWLFWKWRCFYIFASNENWRVFWKWGWSAVVFIYLPQLTTGEYFVNGTVFTYLPLMRTGQYFGNGADLLLFLYTCINWNLVSILWNGTVFTFLHSSRTGDFILEMVLFLHICIQWELASILEMGLICCCFYIFVSIENWWASETGPEIIFLLWAVPWLLYCNNPRKVIQ